MWSSYQAYVGLASRPKWLTCEVIVSLYGSVDNMVAHTRGLREGSISWPSDFDLQRGIFKGWDGVPTDFEERQRIRRANVDEIEAIVTDVVRADWETICARKRGPGGNPMLRLAVWALSKGTDLKQAEVGERVGCKALHVAVVLSRMRRKGETGQPSESGCGKSADGSNHAKTEHRKRLNFIRPKC